MLCTPPRADIAVHRDVDVDDTGGFVDRAGPHDRPVRRLRHCARTATRRNPGPHAAHRPAGEPQTPPLAPAGKPKKSQGERRTGGPCYFYFHASRTASGAATGAEGHATTSDGAYTMSSFSSTAEEEELDSTSEPFCGAIHQPGALPAAVFCTGFPLQATDAGGSVWP